MNGYPDDIRQYDNDPRSPFYVGNPECPECGNEMATGFWEDEFFCEYCQEEEEE